MTAGAVVVHQFCHVGYFSFIGGGSVMAQNVPKYMMVAGERAVLRGLGLNIPNKFSTPQELWSPRVRQSFPAKSLTEIGRKSEFSEAVEVPLNPTTSVPSPAPFDLEREILDWIRTLDPDMLNKIRNLDPAFLDAIRNFDPAFSSEISERVDGPLNPPSVSSPPPYVMNNSVTETNYHGQYAQQKQAEEFPERQGFFSGK
ncbi:hypothetical protein EV2_029202 [Malus domestica]